MSVWWSEKTFRTWFIRAQLGRAAFVNRLRLMAQYPHRLLMITSPLSQVKSRYTHSNVDPNRVTQFLVATLAGLQVPFVYSETHELGEELVGSYLYQGSSLPLAGIQRLRKVPVG